MQKTLLYVGKRFPRPLMATSGSGNNNRLLFVTDRTSGQRYLVDSGAEVSVLPATRIDHQTLKKGLPLRAVNGSAIPISANAPYLCTFASGRILTGLSSWLMSANQLLVQIFSVSKDCSLTSRTTDCMTQKHPAAAFLLTFLTWKHFTNYFSTAHNRYYAILRNFPQLTAPQMADKTPTHGVQHRIVTAGRPTFAKARRLSPAKLAAAKKEFNNLLQLGIIQPSSSTLGFTTAYGAQEVRSMASLW